MYIYDRNLLGPPSWPMKRPLISQPFQRYYNLNPTQAVSSLGGLGLGQVIINDPVAKIGEMLWKWALAGVAVAIYNSGNSEQTRRAIEWANRESAIGTKAKKIDAAELSFGRAIADSGNIVSQLTKLGATLKAAAERVQPPQGITPLAGTGPHLVRKLALFTHGTNIWIGVGGGITTKNASTVIKRIAPVLTPDVTIIIYGCSAARGLKEREGNWLANTMEAGGEDSLAAKIRDALLDEGKLMSSVWGHTEVGHTTRNPSLRFFNAGDGKGTKGHSYAGEFVFGTVERIIALGELEKIIRDWGIAISDEESFRRFAYEELRRLIYDAYISTVIKITTIRGKKVKVTNLTYREANLPEVAPLYPVQVADIILKYWSKVYWPQNREGTAKRLIGKLKLKKKL